MQSLSHSQLVENATASVAVQHAAVLLLMICASNVMLNFGMVHAMHSIISPGQGEMAQWTVVSTKGDAPPALFSPAYVHVGGNHGNIADPRDELWIFGGQKADGTLSSGLYMLDIKSSTWSMISFSGVNVTACAGCCLTWDGGDYLYLRGGGDPKNSQMLNVFSRFSMTKTEWTLMKNQLRYGAYGISNACASFLLDTAFEAKSTWFSGLDNYDFESEPAYTYLFDETMTSVTYFTEGVIEANWYGGFDLGLVGHTLVMGGNYSSAYLFGGVGPNNVNSPTTSVYLWTVGKSDGLGYILLPDKDGPISTSAPSVAYHSAVQINDDIIYVYGGTSFVNWTVDATTHLPTVTCASDLYSYDISSNIWYKFPPVIAPQTDPGARCGHIGIVGNNQNFYLFGGFTDNLVYVLTSNMTTSNSVKEDKFQSVT